MKKRSSLCTLLFFLLASCMAQLDSLRALKSSSDDSLRAEAYLAICSYFNGKNLDSMRYYARMAIKVVDQKEELLFLKSSALMYVGNSFIYERLYDSSTYYYEQVATIIDSARRPLDYALFLSNEGIVFYYLGAYEKALQNFVYSARIREQKGKNASANYNFIAAVNQQTGDLQRAKKAYLKSISEADKYGVDNSASSNLASLYFTLETYDSALFYAQRGLMEARKIGSYSKVSHAMGMIGLASMKLGKFEIALDYLDSAVYQGKRLGAIQKVAEQYSYIAQTMVAMQQPRKALEMLDSALSYSNSPLMRKDVEGQRASIYQDLQRPDKSLESYKAYIAIRDSLDNLERYKQLSELETKYETEKKEQQIASLEQEKVIAELRIQKQNSILIAGGTFLFIVLVAGYAYYRNRTLRLAQQRLITEQQLLRSQMNPHFLFNALGAIHSFIFKGEKREAADYLSTFGELTRDILDQSSEEWITLSKEVETLKKYVEIQMLRFPQVTCAVEVEASLDQEELVFPPMLLQPFIENAFEHGVKHQPSGHINVKIKPIETERIEITICDNGDGITEQQSAHQSKAISITRKRLDLHFPKSSYILNIGNRSDGSGVLVSIALPKKVRL